MPRKKAAPQAAPALPPPAGPSLAPKRAADFTIDDAFAEFEQARQGARAEGQYSAMVGATRAKIAAVGLAGAVPKQSVNLAKKADLKKAQSFREIEEQYREITPPNFSPELLDHLIDLLRDRFLQTGGWPEIEQRMRDQNAADAQPLDDEALERAIDEARERFLGYEIIVAGDGIDEASSAEPTPFHVDADRQDAEAEQAVELDLDVDDPDGGLMSPAELHTHAWRGSGS